MQILDAFSNKKPQYFLFIRLEIFQMRLHNLDNGTEAKRIVSFRRRKARFIDNLQWNFMKEHNEEVKI